MNKCCRSLESFETKEKGKTNRLILNGFWIWWCYEHNQPIAWCETDALKAALKVHREIGDEAENEVLQLQTKDKMKNTDIAKIRQLLKDMLTVANTEPRSTADVVYGDLARKALALLPCSTCNGTKEEIVETFIDHTSGNKIGVLGPCPDCQS